VLVVNGARGTGEIEDLVDLHIQREADIVAQDFEPRMVEEMCDVAPRAREEIVDADDFVAPAQQRVAQMTPDETRAARYKDSLHVLPLALAVVVA
jgi:hypothetical protein